MIAFCLMSNHFHFLLQEPDEGERDDRIIIIGRFMQRLQNSYARYFAEKYRHSGHLFQGTYKNVLITSNEHLNQAKEYILLNPVKKKLVSIPELWPYSSASLLKCPSHQKSPAPPPPT